MATTAAWQLRYLAVADDEADGILDPDEKSYVIQQCRDLATNQDPTHSPTQDVRAIDAYHELRLKGGLLGKKNIRVFFFLWKRKTRILHVLA